MPTVSVLMPVYNAERYVAEAVESILAQTFTDFEFLIVDDGSADRSREILQQYAQKDARIALTSRPNTGYVVALNEMLAIARGEFIARMDADDVSFPKRFERQLEYLRTRKCCMVVGTATEWIDPDGELLKVNVSPSCHNAIDSAHLTTQVSAICHPTAIIRADVFKSVGFYDEGLFGAEDLDLWLRIAEIGELANMAEPLLKYRFHFNKVGFADKQRQVESARIGVLRACARRNIPAQLLADYSQLPRVDSQLQAWAWWALRSGNVATARKYAWRMMIRRPHSLATWRLAYCAIRGH
jgi:glycosyltransferase involved in cell wall biosynthesis